MASQVFTLDEYKVVKAHISKRDFNRISVIDDRINQVFTDVDRFYLSMDELQGQLFIKPRGDSKHPLSLTITTEKGVTQDLLFTPKGLIAQTIILTEKQKTMVQSVALDVKAKELLTDYRQNGNLGKNVHKSIAVKHPWKLVLTNWYKRGNLIAHKFKLLNVSKKTQNIKESELWKPETLALSMDSHEIQPQQAAIVWMVTTARSKSEK